MCIYCDSTEIVRTISNAKAGGKRYKCICANCGKFQGWQTIYDKDHYIEIKKLRGRIHGRLAHERKVAALGKTCKEYKPVKDDIADKTLMLQEYYRLKTEKA